jgi:L-lactate dehydrogenase complex protein LldG
LSASRDEVLARVRAALPKAWLPMPAEPEPDAAAPEPDDLAAIFMREAAAVGAVIHGPMPRHEVTECVATILRGVGAHKLIAWDPPELSVPGIAQGLAAAGFEIVDSRLPADRAGRTKRLLQLGQAEAGLTSVDAGLAETGTLVLTSGPGRPRLASLLPPVHVAILPVERLVQGLGQFLKQVDARTAASIVLVSGPSRTGDIELTLTQGMHGPREVRVVLVS